MTQKIKIHDLFFNRRQLEMGAFLTKLEQYEKEVHGEQDENKRSLAEDRIQAFFPSTARERDVWNLIQKEGSLTRGIDDWKKSGSAIFTFRDDLLQMFQRSDVQGMPINAIQFPYDNLYLYFGDADLFPSFSDQYRIDGLIVSVDSLCRQFKHGKVETLQVITKNILDLRQLHQKSFDFWSKLTGPEAEEKAAYWRSRLDEGKDTHALALKELERQQANFGKYLLLQSDPDSFDYENEKDFWGYFVHMTVEATLVQHNGTIKRLSPQDILDKPYLAAIFEFEKHSSTIANAIESGIKECSGYSADCSFEGLTWESGGSIEDMYGNPVDLESGSWRIDTGEDYEGNPTQEYIRLNNPLNVCNRPEFLDTITRLAFNALCYLNWKDRDVEERYSDPKLQAEITSAPRKKQEKLRAKAGHLGYRKLWFCGYNSARIERHLGTGSSPVITHWRRGHWRNQPYGKALAQTRLTWIRPVIVNQSDDLPTTATIYK